MKIDYYKKKCYINPRHYYSCCDAIAKFNLAIKFRCTLGLGIRDQFSSFFFMSKRITPSVHSEVGVGAVSPMCSLLC